MVDEMQLSVTLMIRTSSLESYRVNDWLEEALSSAAYFRLLMAWTFILGIELLSII